MLMIFRGRGILRAQQALLHAIYRLKEYRSRRAAFIFLRAPLYYVLAIQFMWLLGLYIYGLLYLLLSLQVAAAAWRLARAYH